MFIATFLNKFVFPGSLCFATTLLLLWLQFRTVIQKHEPFFPLSIQMNCDPVFQKKVILWLEMVKSLGKSFVHRTQTKMPSKFEKVRISGHSVAPKLGLPHTACYCSLYCVAGAQ